MSMAFRTYSYIFIAKLQNYKIVIFVHIKYPHILYKALHFPAKH